MTSSHEPGAPQQQVTSSTTLLERYLIAVGRALPWRQRADIIDELRSLLLDEIEERCGNQPSHDAIAGVLQEFGSPRDVAARYAGDKQVIAPGLVDLYYLVLLAMGGAMLVAFTTEFAVNWFEAPESLPLWHELLMVPVQAVGAWLGGVGGATLAFMALGRWVQTVDLHADWSTDELADIEIDEPTYSPRSTSIEIVGGVVLLVLLNTYPEVVSVAEELVARQGLALGHRIVQETFVPFVWALSCVWVAELGLRLLALKLGETTTRQRALGALLSSAEAGVATLMLLTPALWTEGGSWIGFKLILLIIVLANLGDALGKGVKLLRR